MNPANQPNPLLSNVEELLQRYKELHPTLETMLKDLYQQYSVEPLELAIFLNILTGSQISRVMEEYIGLTSEQIDAISRTHLDQYSVTQDQATLVEEIIAHQRITGINLFRLDFILKQLQEESS